MVLTAKELNYLSNNESDFQTALNEDPSFPITLRYPNGETILHRMFSLENPNPAIVDCLLTQPGILNTQDNDGNTPLHRLAISLASDVSGTLFDIFIQQVIPALRNGAACDFSILNHSGESILHTLINTSEKGGILLLPLLQGCRGYEVSVLTEEPNEEDLQVYGFGEAFGLSDKAYFYKSGAQWCCKTSDNIEDIINIEDEEAISILEKALTSGLPEIEPVQQVKLLNVISNRSKQLSINPNILSRDNTSPLFDLIVMIFKVKSRETRFNLIQITGLLLANGAVPFIPSDRELNISGLLNQLLEVFQREADQYFPEPYSREVPPQELIAALKELQRHIEQTPASNPGIEATAKMKYKVDAVILLGELRFSADEYEEQPEKCERIVNRFVQIMSLAVKYHDEPMQEELLTAFDSFYPINSERRSQVYKECANLGSPFACHTCMSDPSDLDDVTSHLDEEEEEIKLFYLATLAESCDFDRKLFGMLGMHLKTGKLYDGTKISYPFACFLNSKLPQLIKEQDYKAVGFILTVLRQYPEQDMPNHVDLLNRVLDNKSRRHKTVFNNYQMFKAVVQPMSFRDFTDEHRKKVTKKKNEVSELLDTDQEDYTGTREDYTVEELQEVVNGYESFLKPNPHLRMLSQLNKDGELSLLPGCFSDEADRASHQSLLNQLVREHVAPEAEQQRFTRGGEPLWVPSR